MSRPVRLALVVGLIAAVGWVGWRPVRAAVFDARAELRQTIARLEADVAKYRGASRDHVRIRGLIDGYVDRTLGGDLETVDHRLRSHLNRIGESLELESLSVGTGRARRLESPARRRLSGALRDEIDFVEIEGWISGNGPLERALRLVHGIRAAPWIKRIDHVRLQPRENGRTFSVTLRLTTLFLPGREPASPPPAAGDFDGFERYASIAGRNPFRVPPAEAPPPQAPAEPGDGLDRGRWVVTGIAAGPSGAAEVWILHRDTKQARTIAAGDAVEGLTLLDAGGDLATFAAGEQIFTVRVGETLADGDPLR